MKFKTLFSGIIFAVGMSAVIVTCINNPQADTYGDWVYSNAYKITGYTGNKTEVTIPYKLGNITAGSVQITEGSDESKANLKAVKKVTFESGYTVMTNTTISGFVNVEELVIPEGVTEIKENAFISLKNLKKVQFPSTLKKIDNSAFSSCNSLESISLPNGFETLGYGVFTGCKGLKSVSLPDSLKEMGYDVFQGCTGLKDEKGLVIVRDHLYYMEIPSGVTEVTIPAGVKVLDGELFSGNKKIKKVTIPDGVTRIDHRIFYLCSNLEEVYIPDSVTYIGTFAFESCTSLKKLRVPSKFERGEDLFRGCRSLQDANGFVVVNGILFDHFGTTDKVVIPDGVKEIEHNVFNGYDMTELSLPNSLNKIGENAFSKCTNLKKVEIPDSVSEIGRNAFSGCSSLSELKLSPNVKTIDFSVFSGTSSLKKVIIPEGVEEVLYNAFSGSGLEEITLPASLKKLGRLDLKAGIKVNYNGTQEQWEALKPGKQLLDKINLNILKDTPVPEVTATVTPTPPSATATPAPVVTSAPSTLYVYDLAGNKYKINGKTASLVQGAKKANVVIPAAGIFNGKKYKVTAIGASAFKSNKKLKSVTIGKNVKVIGKKAFYKASKLKTVIIRSKLLKSSKIGKYAFKGVKKGVVFKVPDSKKKLYSKIIAKSMK